MASYAEMLIGIDRDMTDESADRDSARYAQYIDLDSFLAVTAAMVRIDGYVSRKSASMAVLPILTTADAIQDYFFTTAKTDEEKKYWELRRPTEQDTATAEKAREWALNLSASTDRALNDYEYNLATIARLGVVEPRLIGLAVSLIPAYQRAVGIDIERRKARESSVHFGSVGERDVYTLTLTKVITTDSRYGTTWICKFVDANGNHACWFSSKNVQIEIGETVKLKCTVKEHKEYQGIKETVLTRCTVTKEYVCICQTISTTLKPQFCYLKKVADT
jgi:hypothetical protein